MLMELGAQCSYAQCTLNTMFPVQSCSAHKHSSEDNAAMHKAHQTPCFQCTHAPLTNTQTNALSHLREERCRSVNVSPRQSTELATLTAAFSAENTRLSVKTRITHARTHTHTRAHTHTHTHIHTHCGSAPCPTT